MSRHVHTADLSAQLELSALRSPYIQLDTYRVTGHSHIKIHSGIDFKRPSTIQIWSDNFDLAGEVKLSNSFQYITQAATWTNCAHIKHQTSSFIQSSTSRISYTTYTRR